MPEQLKRNLRILGENTAVALVLALLVYVMNYGAPLSLFWKLLAEVFIYTNLIAYPAHYLLPAVFPCVATRSEAVKWVVLIAALTLLSGVGSLVGSLIVFVLNLEPGVFYSEILAVSFKVAVFVTQLVGIGHIIVGRLQAQLEDTRLKLRTQELERERALKVATEARLAALEARLHPHFLFNTLNSISSLIPADPERAERLVERMAALLRFSLESHQSGLVDLTQEMQIVRDYLEIEQARLGDRLQYRLEAPEDLEGLQVPPLSVQTLVENSVKHAIAPNRQGGEILVRVGRENGHVRVEVADTGPGFAIETAPAGHGLDNLRRRLEALFGARAGLRAARDNGWATVCLEVPA